MIEVAEVPLSGPIYDSDLPYESAKLTLEVRDFGSIDRTLVIRTWVDGEVKTTMVSLAAFEDAFDGMRARIMAPDWDTALIQLTGGNN